ncbi:MAG: Asp23/Gls24 family envelope stress response protein [Ruminococcaceae bacterium]|nr:Asp23/Gls24 family envelope stress response protein [Oscillospiraceae bacterium]
MYVCGLVGPSGTGKSHRALWVAKEHGIDYIIDDGLLICGNGIVAGKSAKRESTRVGAVKTAVFTDDEHTFEVAQALKLRNVERLLILGTSDGMVAKIAKRLGLHGIDETVYINDISSQYEIQQALNTRRSEGKHVIPVPTMELKKGFSGLMLDPLNILQRKGLGDFEVMGEKSVIRPTYSYLGKYTISDYTIYQLSDHIIRDIEGVSAITRFRAEKAEDGIRIDADLVLYYGYNIPEILKKTKAAVRKEIEQYTALNVNRLTLTAKSLVMKKKEKK